MSFCHCTPASSASTSCHCGEDLSASLDWRFSAGRATGNADISGRGREVLFHKTYSTGTAVVLGDAALEPGMHHYWELKWTGPVYGTAVMVGLATERWEPGAASGATFSLVLGKDSESWG